MRGIESRSLLVVAGMLVFVACGQDADGPGSTTDDQIIQPPGGATTPTTPGGDKTGPTHPFPLPDLSQILLSGLRDEPDLVTIVGLPKAVAGAGEVTVQVAEQLLTLTATERGTFAGAVQAEPGAVLSFRFGTSDAVEKQVPTSPAMPAPPPPLEALPGVEPVTRLDAERVEIRGKCGLGPGKQVIAVNFTNGEVLTTTALADSSFQLEIRALAGDDLSLFYPTLVGRWSPTVP